MIKIVNKFDLMKHFETESKKRDIPLVCSKSSASCVYQEYRKLSRLLCL